VIGRASKACAFSYGDAVQWVALNDDPSELRFEFVKATVSVQLVADAFRMSCRTVASDVLALRRAERVGS
jgi:hypothetical protein